MSIPSAQRALAEYRSARPHHVEAGLAWYPSAHGIANEQARTHGVTIDAAAGILAALSPRLGWGPNVRLAERMLRSGGTLASGGLGRSLRQARAIHAGAHPLAVLGGPKTRSFYQAIVSSGVDGNAVIDRHAWDMLLGERGSPPPSRRGYADAVRAMADAAAEVGVPVHGMQAVTWLTWRARWWSSDAFAHNDQPMLEGARNW